MIKNIDYPIADLLPHAPPMVLLDRVEAYQDDFIHTSLTIKESSAFFETDGVPAYIALEYMAQTVAAWNGLMSRQQGENPRVGFLLGARRLTLDVPVFKLGEQLHVYAQANYMDGEMAAFDCWIEINGVRVVQAGLNVFQPAGSADGPSAMRASGI